MDYMIRSMCPFSSMCTNSKCAVVCPMVSDQGPNPGIQGKSCTSDTDCDCSRYAAMDMKRCACISNQCVAVVEE
jgi:hypothetical protein